MANKAEKVKKPSVKTNKSATKIDASGIHYKQLNEMVRDAIDNGAKDVHLANVNGQRYIGAGLKSKDANILIDGVPGNDLAIFMDGPTIRVRENAQDGVSNTMNSGKVIVENDAGDVLGYGMRGGKLFVRGNVGYRVGIHMKAYEELVPKIVVGGRAMDFFGEYMAGGIMVLLGLNGYSEKHPLTGNFVGTGMHGGTIYARGDIQKYQLGKEVAVFDINESDNKLLKELLTEYCNDLGLSFNDVMRERFIKLLPFSNRPYGKLYCNQP